MAAGRLVVVGTPIGNMADLSPRATEALAAAHVVACEDTRRTGRLLQLAGIERPAGGLISVREHNEAAGAADVVRRVEGGEMVVYVTDAGMPAVSDPGQRLVAAVAAAGLTVEVVPGPSAVSAAVAVSGIAAERFCFEGFLPRKGRERAERLAAVAGDDRASVLYESPHRVAATLADLTEVCGADRQVAVCRELTKLHEEVWRGALGAAAEHFAAEPARGEVAVVVAGAEPARAGAEVTDEALDAAVQAALAQGTSARDAAAEVAAELGVPKRRAYEAATRAKRA